MNHTEHDDDADGQPCRWCGAGIEEREGRAVREGEETVAYVHADCPDCA